MQKEHTMRTVISKDGTPIAFDRSGQGSALILVTGALNTRPSSSLAARLAQRFSVFAYDRRGRGESGDTLPYAALREIEDIDALVAEADGSAFLFGQSSGGALALEAALQLGGDKVKKLAIYEVPYNDDPEFQQAWRVYLRQLSELLAANRRGDAVALFMRYVGMPAEQIEGMRHSPSWSSLEALAPTLAYDHAAILGEDISVPTGRAAQVRVPTLLINGSASFPFMYETARTLSQAIPHAQLRTLEGQDHAPADDVLAPALEEFFLS